MSTPNRWAVRSVAKASFYSLVDGKLLTYLDTLKSSGIETKSTTVYARGGHGNVKLIGFSSDKECSITLQDALFDNKVMALLTGNSIIEGAKDIYKRDILSVNSSYKATLTKTPVGDLIGVYKLNPDGSNGNEFTKVTTVSADNEYSISNKELTFNTTVVEGTNIVAYYKVNSGSTSKTIKVTSDAFGGSFKLVLDVLVTDYATKQLYPAQIVVFNCKMEDNWKLEFKPDGDPAVLDIPIEVLKSPTTTDMWQMTIFDEGEIN